MKEDRVREEDGMVIKKKLCNIGKKKTETMQRRNEEDNSNSLEMGYL